VGVKMGKDMGGGGKCAELSDGSTVVLRRRREKSKEFEDNK